MKLKKMIAAFTLCGTMLLPAMKVSAVPDDVLTEAFISGTIGSTTVETADNATIGSTVAEIDGDAEYQAEWVITDGGSVNGLNAYIAISMPKITADSFPDIYVNVKEVYVDGVKINYSMSSNALNTAFYEAGKDPETRVYLFDAVKGTNVKDIPADTKITKSLKVIFTVTGTGAYGTSNVDSTTADTTEPATTTAAPDDNTEDTTTTTVTTTSDDEADMPATTGNSGVAAAAVIGLTVTAGTAVLSKVKIKRKKK